MSLSEWLDLVDREPPNVVFVNYCFPNERMREEYLSTARQRSEGDVKRLLEKFLVPSCWLVADDHRLEFLKEMERDEPLAFEKAVKLQSTTRLFRAHYKMSESPPWEGITWILDLLPDSPREALGTIFAYLIAHYLILPDGKIDGLEDAQTVIRARYIGTPNSMTERIAVLVDLIPRAFEYLIEKLYKRMGYETVLTAATRDGGRDIIATNRSAGKQESIRIECKKYIKPVGVPVLRALLGVVSDEKANKGVLITTADFTKDTYALAQRNPRIELIDGKRLVVLLNEYLGERWPFNLDRIITQSMRHSGRYIGA
jgi:restriction system protein